MRIIYVDFRSKYEVLEIPTPPYPQICVLWRISLLIKTLVFKIQIFKFHDRPPPRDPPCPNVVPAEALPV